MSNIQRSWSYLRWGEDGSPPSDEDYLLEIIGYDLENSVVFEEAKDLIDTIKDINFILAYGRTILMCASREKVPVKIMELLIEKGANINAKDEEGHTALYFATFVGSLELVKLLIDNGADLNLKYKDRFIGNVETVLDIATRLGNHGMTKLILEAMEAQNDKGRNRSTNE